jgi:hypothetical protein
MDFDPMWIWWGVLVALCAWKLVEGLLKPALMLEWPFLACAMWIYFYGYMAWEAKMNLSAYLGHGMANIGEFVALLCLIGLLAGWSIGRRLAFGRPPEARRFPLTFCWLSGMAFVAVGAFGSYMVASDVEVGEVTTYVNGYAYMLFYVGYPGMAIAIWAALKAPSPVKWMLLAVTALGVIAFMLPHVLNARRGPLFPAVIVLLLVPSLTLKKAPNRLLYCGVLVLAGLAMLLFLQVRSVTYNGGSWGEALQTIDVSAVAERGDEADDNEFVNNCQLISTIYHNGKYQYGTGHLELLVHWIPRQWWWAKPALGEGSYPFNQMFDDVERATGVRLLGFGASSAGVADSFVQYGFLCPIYWFVLAGLTGALYTQVIRSPNPTPMYAYVGFLCASHWLISQSFSAAFVPAMYFQVTPLCLWVAVAVYRKWFPAPRKLRPRRDLAPAAPPATTVAS